MRDAYYAPSCHPRSPYAPEPPVVAICDHCGETIYLGDHGWRELDGFGGDNYKIHEECLTDFLEVNKPLVTNWIYDDMGFLLDLISEFYPIKTEQ